MSKRDYAKELDDLFKTKYADVKIPCGIAAGWIREGREGAEYAVKALMILALQNPTSIRVGQELVLAFIEADRVPEAWAEVHRLERDFGDHNDEETLCRMGRLHRLVGDGRVRGTRNSALDHLARVDYDRAWEYYHRAFAPPHLSMPTEGYYPGINRASLFLLRGWLHPAGSNERRDLVQSARDAARRLLDREKTHPWLKLEADDDIWQAATRGEAYLLLASPTESQMWYAAALTMTNGKEMYGKSMVDQLHRLRPALLECLSLVEVDLHKIIGLFTPSPVVTQATQTLGA